MGAKEACMTYGFVYEIEYDKVVYNDVFLAK